MFAQEILFEMDTTIDQLIVNAMEMSKTSKVNIIKKEIDLFQQKQEELISKLIRLDNDYKVKYDEIKKPNLNSASNIIRKKLKHFETLNNEFIKNTANELNVINFEEKRSAKKIKTKRKRPCFKNKN